MNEFLLGLLVVSLVWNIMSPIWYISLKKDHDLQKSFFKDEKQRYEEEKTEKWKFRRQAMDLEEKLKKVEEAQKLYEVWDDEYLRS